MMCAVSAKTLHSKLRVAIIEKNDRVGKKLIATGNGRCNLTNLNVSAEHYRGSFQPKLGSVLSRYGADELLGHFRKLGLLTFADSEGRCYPLCRQASAVLDVLRYACDRMNVEIYCGETVKSIRNAGGSFCVTTHENTFTAPKLVIACGSKASPIHGGSASAADYLRNFGHKFIPFSPALCPVKTDYAGLKALKGIRAAAKAALIRNGQIIACESGEVQFTANALSGICVFNLSLDAKPNDIIELDLLENISLNELLSIFRRQRGLFEDLTCDCLLTGILQKRLAQAVLKASGMRDFTVRCCQLDNEQLQRIAYTVKHFRFNVTENSGFDQAQCALGGVVGNEIDEHTMQSKLCRGLYVCGEAIDICGECGGYNLHFAFAGGMIAGESL